MQNHDRVSERAAQQRAKAATSRTAGLDGPRAAFRLPRRATIVNARRQQATANLAPSTPSPQPARQATKAKNLQNPLPPAKAAHAVGEPCARRRTPADTRFTVNGHTTVSGRTRMRRCARGWQQSKDCGSWQLPPELGSCNREIQVLRAAYCESRDTDQIAAIIE
jgi:hypothetical protein